MESNGQYELQPDTEERREKAKEALKMFKFFKKGECIIPFGDYEQHSDASSEIENPFFEDDDQLSNLSKIKKGMSQIEATTFLMNSFTDDFKALAKEMQEKIKIDNNIRREGLTSYNVEQSDKESVDEEFEKKVKQLSTFSIKKLPKTELDKNPKAPQTKESKKPKPVQVFEPSENNTLSGIWRMLEGESMKNGFPITEIGYNVLEDKRLDWLIREDIDWNDKEITKKKCEDWMRKNKKYK